MTKKTVILILSIFYIMTSCSTKKTANSVDSYGLKTAAYQLPSYDFVVFSDNRNNHFENMQKYTFEFDEELLRHSIAVAKRMSSIPPIVVTFYKNGVQTENALCGFLLTPLNGKELQKNPLVKKTETFSSLDDYKNRHEELQQQGNSYILKKESNSNNEYVLTWYEYQKEKQ